MTTSTRFSVLLAAATLVASSSVLAQTTPAASAPAASAPQTVNVQGVAPKPHRVAPAWDQGRAYKFRDIVNYDGWVFQAGSGAGHKRPNADDGWEKLNACDDLSEGAIQCEVSNQAKTGDQQNDAQREYNRVKQDMNKGKPTNSPEG